MSNQNRRNAIKNLVAGTAAIGASSMIPAIAAGKKKNNNSPLKLKGNVNHSVCQWCYGHMPLEELCVLVKSIGFNAIDLISPKYWPILQKHGIYSSMCYTDGEISLTKGLNNKDYHDKIVGQLLDVFPKMVEAGYKNVICFSGNRNGMDDQVGLDNCVEALKRVMPAAEKHGITVQMELLNSKVDHRDYMCDKSAWGVALCKKLGSPNFKLLYDIYHMQIDEGDVIHTIKENHQYFGHYHTAGVPGRHELDENQELQYPAIMKAIVATGFKGYVAQEFIPIAADKSASLKTAVALCDV
jgi:hydroxypyruvate isomerase